jgi:opacity protein-like surface antigen
MSGLKRLIFVSSALNVLAGTALAADLGQQPMTESAPVAQQSEMVEFGTGWYIRGDIGYSDYATPKAQAYGATQIQFDRERLKSTITGGVGFGYKFLNWLRGDITLDYRDNAAFSGTTSASNYVNGYSIENAKYESTTLLVNGYVDLGEWSGISTYIGAGIGMAHNRLQNYRAQANCYVVCNAGVPAGLQPATYLPPGTRYNIAWALMAGVGVTLGSGFTLDAGYRYVNLGEAKTKLDAFSVGAKMKDLSAHEFRLGLRYMID